MLKMTKKKAEIGCKKQFYAMCCMKSGARGKKLGKKKEKENKKKQSQKRYMVSGSLCPLISFLDVSFSVSFVVRGQRPRRGR